MTGWDIGNDGCGNILFGGGLGEGDGKNEVDAENKADDVTAAVSPLDPVEPTEPEIYENWLITSFNLANK